VAGALVLRAVIAFKFDCNAVFVGAMLECFRVRHPFRFDQEPNCIPSLACREVFPNVLGRRHGKRWGFLIDERRQPEMVAASFLELHKFSNDLHSVECCVDFVDCALGYAFHS